MNYLDYLQLICLFSFVVVFLGRSLYLRVFRGIHLFSLGVGKKAADALLELVFLVVFIAWVAEVFLYATHGAAQFLPSALNTVVLNPDLSSSIGVFLLLIGFATFFWGLASMGNSWRIGIDKKSPGELVTGGAFGWSRNPVFGFIDLYFIGTFLLTGTIFFLVTTILIIGGLHLQILREEQFLSETIGQAYQGYCAQTGRYFSPPKR